MTTKQMDFFSSLLRDYCPGVHCHSPSFIYHERVNLKLFYRADLGEYLPDLHYGVSYRVEVFICRAPVSGEEREALPPEAQGLFYDLLYGPGVHHPLLAPLASTEAARTAASGVANTGRPASRKSENLCLEYTPPGVHMSMGFSVNPGFCECLVGRRAVSAGGP